jgi:hypothetical protein
MTSCFGKRHWQRSTRFSASEITRQPLPPQRGHCGERRGLGIEPALDARDLGLRSNEWILMAVGAAALRDHFAFWKKSA